MSILIRGMELPKAGEHVLLLHVYHDGTASIIGDHRHYKNEPFEIVPILPHGRLIDEQWLKNAMITTLESLKKNPKMDMQEIHLIAAFNTLRAMVENAPTIIEAEEGK